MRLLSKRTEYGLRAAVHLAACYERGYIQTREISRRERLPNKFLESILRSMKSAGLVESKVGASGGYRLGARPESITVGKLVKALEGELVSPDERAAPTAWATVLVSKRVRDAIADAIGTFSLAELLEEVNRAQNRSQSMYYI